jgi:prepilin-type N-terminal cleavage/methylation domain-containing protein
MSIRQNACTTELKPRRSAAGFTLIEVAIVTVIAALLLGAFLLPLAGQIEARKLRGARAQLAQIEEALLGFVVANRRLPCPASSTSDGRESFCSTDTGACAPTTTAQTHGRCSNFSDGFLPAATLGISPTDANGFALDPWESATSRWRYAVSDVTVNPINHVLTVANGIRDASAQNIAQQDLLLVCGRSGSTTTSGASASCGTGVVALTQKAPAVVWSVGRNLSESGVGDDEQENGDGDRFFVSRDITDGTSPDQQFDDIVGWLSLNVLISRMLTAGQL